MYQPLAVVETMVSIGIAIAIGSVAQSVVAVAQSVGAIGVPGVSLSLGLRLSLSGPLAVVETMVSIGVAVSIGSVASISVGVGTIAIIAQPWVSLSLRLGLWLTGHEGGKTNLEEYLYFTRVGQLVVSSYHKSELHCCLSVQFRMIPERRRAQFIAPQSPPVRAPSRLLAFRSPPPGCGELEVTPTGNSARQANHC